MNGKLTTAQINRLLQPVRSDRVEQKQKLTYVPAHEVKAELSRIFGPGNWDHSIHDVRLLWESEGLSADGKKNMFRACYMAACTLRVRDYNGNPVFETTEYHAEANSNLPDRGEAHAMALTSCESYALRRAALDLGDAMGLHLYNSGSLVPLVKGTLMMTGDIDSPLYVEPPKEEEKTKQSITQASTPATTHGTDDIGPQGEHVLSAAPATGEGEYA